MNQRNTNVEEFYFIFGLHKSIRACRFPIILEETLSSSELGLNVLLGLDHKKYITFMKK